MFVQSGMSQAERREGHKANTVIPKGAEENKKQTKS